MKKKLLMTTAASALSLGVLAACGGEGEDPSETPGDPPMEDPAGGEGESAE
ncbi:hypothetical protein [Shouchella shacheensis]|uniref:hypothetical protein n=1 Tax=Shouchella shacheensis TaxID=1649580 RepID=UPI000AA02F62|nr:hypothetical protein [Shouchella shacheensis]